MKLKEKLELLNEKSSLRDIQDYIKDMETDRGFDTVPIERKMMLMLEEFGELSKAIRISTKEKIDVDKTYDTSVEEELADVFIYLLNIANMNEVDMIKAFKHKEEKNFNRTWK